MHGRFRIETSQYLVNIQPNLKSHPPPKLSGSAPGPSHTDRYNSCTRSEPQLAPTFCKS